MHPRQHRAPSGLFFLCNLLAVGVLVVQIQASKFSKYKTCKACVAAGFGWSEPRQRCGGFPTRECAAEIAAVQVEAEAGATEAPAREEPEPAAHTPPAPTTAGVQGDETAAGAAGLADEQEEKLQLIRDVTGLSFEPAMAERITIVVKDPMILTIANFLNDEECRWFKKFSTPSLEQSTLGGEDHKSHKGDLNVRNSMVHYWRADEEHQNISMNIKKSIAAALDIRGAS